MAYLLDTVIVVDPTNPVELVTWTTTHPLDIIQSMQLRDNVYTIFYSPAPIAGSVSATQSGIWTTRTQDGTGAGITSTSVNGRQAIDTRRADVSLVAVTAVGTSGAAVTATLPAAASVFHYIQSIKIIRYATAAITGSATPSTVTTTNLPGNIAFTFGTAQAIGTTLIWDYPTIDALRSSISNTATTIVCPATTSVIWRIVVLYYTTG